MAKKQTLKSRLNGCELGLCASVLLIALPIVAHADNAKNENNTIDKTVIVSATRPALPAANIIKDKPIIADGARDAAAIIENENGVSIIRTGSQTGLIALRGLAQDRVKVRMNGIEMVPACPNHMDPPLHYVDSSQIGAISITNGVTSVADGGDSIAGAVIVNSKSPEFSKDGKAKLSGEVNAAYFDANNGYDDSLALNLGLNSAAFRFSTSVQNGDDLQYKGGKASLTGYNARHYNLDGEIITPIGQLGLGLGLQQTRNAGTPALGMDIVSSDASSIRLGLLGNYDKGKFSALLYHNDINHVMDNFTMRTYTMNSMRMTSPATSTDDGYNISYSMPLEGFNLKIGSDGHFNDFNVTGTMGMMQMQSFINSSRDRIGGYAEIDGKLNHHLSAKLGLRYDNIQSDTDNIAQYMMSSMGYAQAFNAKDHKKDFDNFEYSAAFRLHINDNLTLNLNAARKMRAPNLIELYLFAPNSTYGQADGRNYLGNLDLKAETSNQIETAAVYAIGNLKLSGNAFYNKIDNFIQGVTIDNSPNATLQFQNLDAEVYGAEFSADYIINDIISIYGATSYARGKDTTHNDNLYRFAPLRGVVGIKAQYKGLEGLLETKFVAKQDKVAQYNNEQETPSYQIINLRGRYKLNDDIGINFGVENLLDKYYYDHLSGINRVDNAALGGTLAIGDKVPGTGRSVYFGINYKF